MHLIVFIHLTVPHSADTELFFLPGTVPMAAFQLILLKLIRDISPACPTPLHAGFSGTVYLTRCRTPWRPQAMWMGQRSVERGRVPQGFQALRRSCSPPIQAVPGEPANTGRALVHLQTQWSQSPSAQFPLASAPFVNSH